MLRTSCGRLRCGVPFSDGSSTSCASPWQGYDLPGQLPGGVSHFYNHPGSIRALTPSWGAFNPEISNTSYHYLFNSYRMVYGSGRSADLRVDFGKNDTFAMSIRDQRRPKIANHEQPVHWFWHRLALKCPYFSSKWRFASNLHHFADTNLR